MSIWGGGFVQASAAKKAAAQTAAAIREGIAEQKRQYDAGVARLSPYETFGREEGMNRFRDWLASGGVKAPTGPIDVTEDPGYQFRLQSGEQGLEGSAAARGMLKSGDTLRAMQKYGQDLGSQEYGNAFNRRQVEYGNRLQEGGFLSNIMGSGQNAAVGQNALGTNMANQISQAQNQIGSAEAQGTMGSANAFSSMLGQFGGLASTGLGAYLGSRGSGGPQPHRVPGGSNVFSGGEDMGPG